MPEKCKPGPGRPRVGEFQICIALWVCMIVEKYISTPNMCRLVNQVCARMKAAIEQQDASKVLVGLLGKNLTRSTLKRFFRNDKATTYEPLNISMRELDPALHLGIIEKIIEDFGYCEIIKALARQVVVLAEGVHDLPELNNEVIAAEPATALVHISEPNFSPAMHVAPPAPGPSEILTYGGQRSAAFVQPMEIVEDNEFSVLFSPVEYLSIDDDMQ